MYTAVTAEITAVYRGLTKKLDEDWIRQWIGSMDWIGLDWIHKLTQWIGLVLDPCSTT